MLHNRNYDNPRTWDRGPRGCAHTCTWHARCSHRTHDDEVTSILPPPLVGEACNESPCKRTSCKRGSKPFDFSMDDARDHGHRNSATWDRHARRNRSHAPHSATRRRALCGLLPRQPTFRRPSSSFLQERRRNAARPRRCCLRSLPRSRRCPCIACAPSSKCRRQTAARDSGEPLCGLHHVHAHAKQPASRTLPVSLGLCRHW
mmetsp:Transcript_12982/g.35890  ORF Transcript_12982/g.35890 Transcript_12982/m.35890 type:complete len:203 (+) Transcript_12982:1074-1682(+)